MKFLSMFSLVSIVAICQILGNTNDRILEQPDSKTSNPFQNNDSILQFTEVWVWSFYNEWVSASAFGHTGELAVYYHPKLKCWLFTAEAFGNNDGIEWVIAQPDGIYTTAFRDEFGNLQFQKDTISLTEDAVLGQNLIKGQGRKSFGEPSLGFASILGEEYFLNYTKSSDQSSFFIGNVSADLRPVYHFNQLSLEAKLPVSFPIFLPSQTVILSEQSVVSNRHISLEFKYISHADYQIVMP